MAGEPAVTVWLAGSGEEPLGPTTLSASVGHDENLIGAIWVLQLKFPVACRYSLVYQKVQSSVGSTDMLL